MQKQIEAQQQEIKDLEGQKQIYQEKIEIKREEAVTLKNQIYLLSNQVLEREAEIQEKEKQIAKTNLSIKNIQLRVLEKKQEIEVLKQDLKEFLQTINQYDHKNHLEIILLNDSISDIFFKSFTLFKHCSVRISSFFTKNGFNQRRLGNTRKRSTFTTPTIN